jgi:linalool dehydratase/isomerase-like protein
MVTEIKKKQTKMDFISPVICNHYIFGVILMISGFFRKKIKPHIKRVFISILSLIIAAAIWLPLVHIFYSSNKSEFYSEDKIPQRAKEIAKRHLELWTDPDLRKIEIEKMRRSNAEWDFMGRTFLVLSCANMVLREPEESKRYLEVIDHIIEETISLEKENGHFYFLMDYAKEHSFVVKPARSVFIDGEIAIMICARRLVKEKNDLKPMLKERIDIIVSQMEKSPVLWAESYPDECWTFCNSIALASIRISDVLDGTDHSKFINRWLDIVREELVHEDSGILVSTCTVDGLPMEGPEGSTIWTAAHFLQVVDEEFAGAQYEKARKQLGKSVLGFGWAKEWPESWKGKMDIDSGPIVPVMEASAGSSGQALIAAASFGDLDFFSALNASLEFAAFPVRKNGNLEYCASNQVGDAVLLYSMTLGPLWKELKKRGNK